MLFSSFAFIYVFLPVTCLVFFWTAPRSQSLAALWLVIASLAFYGWWNPVYVLLLSGSICFNYFAARLILNFVNDRRYRLKNAALIAAISVNLGVLSYYKYAGFFVRNIASMFDANWGIEAIALPLGISFFTFTQISFLVDIWRGEVKSLDPVHYALFVTYFPHLIAGPILHHREMIPQFAAASTYRFEADNVAAGLTMFSAGLFKKVIIADSIAKYADPVFAAAGNLPVSLFEAWGGALAYTLQIYFDFSGYSDMAIGLSMLFGIRIPLNFNSPYKATSIIDFWRRWHISLSTFLRDYLYVPLGGNRLGSARRYLNLMITMLLGGLWHGAGWTFVIWGGLHGVYLIVNHFWDSISGMAKDQQVSVFRSWSSRTLTFLAVVMAWVFFRSDSLETAFGVLRGMVGLNGIILPETWVSKLGPVGLWLSSHNVRFESMPLYGGASQVVMIGVLLGVAWMAPNTLQMLGSRNMALGKRFYPSEKWEKWIWKPNFTFAVFTALTLSACLISMYYSSGSEFIYYNF